MGNEHNICNKTHTQHTNLELNIIEQRTIKTVIHQIKIPHKSITDFLNSNTQFFEGPGKSIGQVILSDSNYEEEINKYPIQRISQNKKIFFPNLNNAQFQVYQGQCMLLDYLNEQFYIGQVINAKKQGLGILISKKGNKFNGYFHNDIQNGEGTYEIIYPKRVYKSNWKNGKLQGRGEATYEDGAKYQGYFFNGKKHGQGILHFPDGAVYEGSFSEDLMHGYGCLSSLKGHQISGQWKQGKYQKIKPERSSRTFSINELPA